MTGALEKRDDEADKYRENNVKRQGENSHQ
jgi:hypothetical protein